MGPQHIAAENLTLALGFVSPVELLQWGRSTSLRKTNRSCSNRRRSARASMGPQHIAAENALRAGPAAHGSSASMGPQHIAAENHSTSASTAQAMILASMGPQHIAAENLGDRERVTVWAASLQWGRSTSLRKTKKFAR